MHRINADMHLTSPTSQISGCQGRISVIHSTTDVGDDSDTMSLSHSNTTHHAHTRLPDELWLCILSHLAPRDVMLFSCACRDFNRIAADKYAQLYGGILDGLVIDDCYLLNTHFNHSLDAFSDSFGFSSGLI